MFKYNSCVYETYGYYPQYPQIYFDDHRHFVYAHRAVCCTQVNITIISCGVMIALAIDAAEELRKKDIRIRIINM